MHMPGVYRRVPYHRLIGVVLFLPCASAACAFSCNAAGSFEAFSLPVALISWVVPFFVFACFFSSCPFASTPENVDWYYMYVQ